MSLQSAHGTISILSTDTVSTTKVVSGLGFAPQLVLFWASGQTSATDAVGAQDQQLCFGFATSATSRRAQNGYSQNGATTTRCRAGYSDVAVVEVCDNTTDLVGELDIQSFDAGGFTAVIDNQFPFDLRVHWLAIGGGDITNLSVDSFQVTTAGTTQSITTPGFQADCLLLVTGGRVVTAPPNAGADSTIFIGANDGTRQWCAGSGANTAVVLGVTQSLRHGRSGSSLALCIGPVGAIAVEGVTAITSTGFDVTWDSTPGTAQWVFYVAIKGGKWRVDSLTTRVDGADIAKSGFGFQPTAAFFASVGQAEHASLGSSADAMLSLGGAASVSARGVMAGSDQDNVATTSCAAAVEYDEVYCRIDPSTNAVVGLMDLKSFDSDGLTAVMDDTDPDAAWCGFIAFGAPPAGSDLSWMPQFGGSVGRGRVVVAP